MLNHPLFTLTMKKNWSLLLLFALGNYACTKDKADPACELADCITSVSYQNDIAPIISQSCATNLGPGTGCHDAWIFEYDNVYGQVRNGAIQHVIIDTKEMPPIPNNFGIMPLTDDEIQQFACWICNGALNN